MKLKKFKAGERIAAQSDTIDAYHLIVKGKIGVFYPDPKIKTYAPNKVAYMTEVQAQKEFYK